MLFTFGLLQKSRALHINFIGFEKNMILIKQCLAIGVLVSLPFVAMAQQMPQRPNSLVTNASVPEASYESAFKNYQPASDEQGSPDKVWRAANDEVGRLGGHVGHITPASHTKSEAAVSSAPAASAARPGHGHHHHH